MVFSKQAPLYDFCCWIYCKVLQLKNNYSLMSDTKTNCMLHEPQLKCYRMLIERLRPSFLLNVDFTHEK